MSGQINESNSNCMKVLWSTSNYYYYNNIIVIFIIIIIMLLLLSTIFNLVCIVDIHIH